MNKIHLVGRLTKDPELKFTAGTGNAITKFTLAVNRPQFDKSKPQEADFINCVCFGKRAEAIANYTSKGHRFCVSGRLQINKYVDKDGNNRWSTDVFVEDFEFMQDKGADNNNNYSSNQNNAATTQSNNTPDYTEVPGDDSDIPF
ncbi:MAG: single-strand binding family protein [Anaerocolumna sp.]|jgi:single-strand DNA-binding protein|nr:single-strand binding family protein [Anaerocolumna sp.]